MSDHVRPHDSRERLLLAAEQLYAERGPGVSLRDIAVAAGQRNNSAVNYYFGSRDGLVEFVVDRRTTAMEDKRTLLLAAATGTDPDLPALVRILVEPMLTVPYEQGSTHYARFLEQVRAHPVIVDWLRGDRQWSATKKVTDLIARHLDHLPARARGRRIAATSTVLFALAADRERAVAAGRSALSADEIVAILIGALRADVATVRPSRG
ncbi:TetR/AcrR family transcriptional regulator [Nocardia spumae]|uniref:TetR/AcrR family transcriptional regulator n=1 Tax=Nocardia spumae TaxID=2887190 RepID=UPI001D14E99F|nr:TetR/AcrR family transcriptional regulator [Nocardia spumae]